jgi:hypothetical protein
MPRGGVRQSRGGRSPVTRLVVVAGLAVTFVAGSVALGQPTDASAAPRTCKEALMLSQMYINHSHAFLAIGDAVKAAYYAGKAEGVLIAC